MSDPAYQEFSSAAIMEVAWRPACPGAVGGESKGNRGVIQDPSTDVLNLYVVPTARASLPGCTLRASGTLSAACRC